LFVLPIELDVPLEKEVVPIIVKNNISEIVFLYFYKKNKHMKKTLLLLTLLFCGITHSQNVFREYFNTYTAGTQLSGQGTWINNSSSVGGLGACAGAICSNAQVLATSMSYNGYGASPKSVKLMPDTDACGTAFTAQTATNTYFGLVLNISNAVSSAPTDFFRVMSGSNSNVAFRITLQSFTGGFYVGISKGTGSVFYFSTAISYNTDHLIVLRYTKAAGTTDDVLRMYVDPVMSQGEPTTPDMAATTGTDASGNLDRMCIRQNASIGLPTGRVGLISVAGSWTGLIFPTLSNDAFEKSEFIVSTHDVKSGSISITTNQTIEKGTFAIYDMLGRCVERKNVSLTSDNNTIAIQPIQVAGIYIVEITSENSTYTKKIIVE